MAKKPKQEPILVEAKLVPAADASELGLTSPELVKIGPRAQSDPNKGVSDPNKPVTKYKPKGNVEGIDYNKIANDRAIAGMAQAEGITLDKHSEKLRYKIAYSAHKLADELATSLSSKVKKDKEYIKGLVWSLGVLYDKLAASDSGTIAVRIPSKLLDNVKVVIAMQVEKKSKTPIDITPTTPTPLDSVSSDTSIKS